MDFQTKNDFIVVGEAQHRIPVSIIENASNYAAFEREVRLAISSLYSSKCSQCRAVCCKIDFCKESIDSLWLTIVRELFVTPTAQYSKNRGWLTPHGCALAAGRPPVCYEFFCPGLLKEIVEPFKFYAVNVLGLLVSHVGKRALLGRHLVTLFSMEEINRINQNRFQAHLDEARNALDACRLILFDDTVNVTALRSLERIQKYERNPLDTSP